MIARDVFYDRRDSHCRKCEFWKGVCLKGHALSSPQGCPVKKFPPIQNADYAPDREVPKPGEGGGAGCCGQAADMPPVSWGQVVGQFKSAMVDWTKAGLPVVSQEEHSQRVGTCRSNECGQYWLFYCKQCKCVAFLKAKLATEDCPKGLWPHP